MKFSTPGIPLLIAAALSSAPAVASAGELAARSRGSVFISITIPPHLFLQQAPPAAAPGAIGEAQGLCFRTNGFDNFHLVLLGSASEQLPVPRPAIAHASCAALPAELPGTSRIGAVPSPGGQHEPTSLTILVVPD